MRPARAPRLDTLTGMRFIAALGAVIFHLPKVSHAVFGYHWFANGYIGMPFFFALSGFVLVWTHPPNDTPRRFWRRRFARIYPLYLASLIPGIVLALGHQEKVSALSTALSIPMLQAWVPTNDILVHNPNFPSWSMSTEAFMYIAFPVLIVLVARCSNKRLLQVLVGIFAYQLAALILVDHLQPHPVHPLLYFFPAYQAATFIAGMLVAKAVQRGVRFPPLPVAASISLVLFVAIGFLPGHVFATLNLNRLPWLEFFATPFALMVIGAGAQTDLAGAPSPFRARPIVTLGIWSYALYLVQGPMYAVLVVIFPSGFSFNPVLSNVENVGAILLAIGIAGVAHKLIEVPCNRWLRHAPPPIIAEPEIEAAAEREAGPSPAYLPAG